MRNTHAQTSTNSMTIFSCPPLLPYHAPGTAVTSALVLRHQPCSAFSFAVSHAAHLSPVISHAVHRMCNHIFSIHAVNLYSATMQRTCLPQLCCSLVFGSQPCSKIVFSRQPCSVLVFRSCAVQLSSTTVLGICLQK